MSNFKRGLDESIGDENWSARPIAICQAFKIA